jgi:plastocyanin
MAAVSLDLIQTGSGSSEIHAQPGDTITFEMNQSVFSNLLTQAVNHANNVLNYVVGGVIFAVSTAGAAGTVLSITQSGSGSTSIAAEAGDTVTLEIANTVETNVLAAAKRYLQALQDVTGVIFAINTSGGAT